MQSQYNRRRFVAGIAAVGAAGLAGPSRPASAEPPPEVTTIRLPANSVACNAPLYMAEESLHEEGFTEVRYLAPPYPGLVENGGLDFDMYSAFDYLPLVDAGKPVTVLAGMHAGCMELRANDSIHSVADLRGRRVGIRSFGSTDHGLVSVMAAYVGLNPAADINWIKNTTVSQVELFTAGKIDAFIGFPPDPGQPCLRDAGQVIVNIARDRPWSNYFCCMAVTNADFVRNNPVATKRALRALLKAADLCHQQPERVVQRMAGLGFSRECTMMTLNDARYGLWRDYDPGDSVRFFALRLNEVGMVKKTPNEIVSQFTDWRFLNELKRELKT